jgi:hypothetical protein
MIKLLCVGLKTESGAALRQLSGCHGRRESNEVVMRERRAGHGLCFRGRHDVRSARTLLEAEQLPLPTESLAEAAAVLSK